jgi:hypothetical protein
MGKSKFKIVEYSAFILVTLLFLWIYKKSTAQGFVSYDFYFELHSNINNINAQCLPCGLIGDVQLDSINKIWGVHKLNSVRQKNKSTFYYIKFKTSVSIDSIRNIYINTQKAKFIAVYNKSKK